MTSCLPTQSSGSAVSGERPARSKVLVLADDGAASLPGRVPAACPTCGHDNTPVLRCTCRHLDQAHRLAADESTRTGCADCGCTQFTPPQGERA